MTEAELRDVNSMMTALRLGRVFHWPESEMRRIEDRLRELGITLDRPA